MKRLITFTLTSALFFSFTGCNSVGGENAVTENGLDTAFQTEADITLDEMNATGTLCRFGDGMWEIEFNSPNTLSGVKLEFDAGTSTASYKGLSFSVPQSALPMKSMMNNLISVTDELAQLEELSGEKENGEIKINGNLESGEYILTADKNGYLKGFEMPGMKLSMKFGEIKEIGSQPEVTTSSSTPAEIQTTLTETSSESIS